MNSHNWQTFFDHHAPHYMGEIFVTATVAEMDFLVNHLHLEPGMRLLDVGCGVGRHAIELARRGYQMTGVDISRGMLDVAQQTAAAAGVTVTWVHCPAQEYTTPALFDAVYSVCEGALSRLCLDDAFDRDALILDNMFNALKPGGYALLTVLNGMRCLRKYTEADVQSGHFDPLTMTEQGTLTIATPTGSHSIPTRERGYIPTELRLMLQHAGFTVKCIGRGTAGAWSIQPPAMDEMEILALAQRPAVG